MRDFLRRLHSFSGRSMKRGEIATTVTIVILGILLGGGILANQIIETGTRLFSRAQVPGTVPNCKDIDGPTTIFVGEPAVYQATFSSPTTKLTGGFFLDGAANIPLSSPKQFTQQFLNYSGGNVGAALQWTWTPTANDVGGHAVYCRAINGTVAECRPPGMVDTAPGNQSACAGPAMLGQPTSVIGKPIYVAPSRSVIPNCSINSISPTTITAGQPVTVNVKFDSQAGDLRGALYVDNDAGQIFNRFYGQGTTVTSATENIKWTPTAAQVGNHTIYCTAWYDGKAECRPSNLVDKNPRFPCAGNASQSVTVAAPVPPTSTPTPPTSDVCSQTCNQQFGSPASVCSTNTFSCPNGTVLTVQGYPGSNYCGGKACCCGTPINTATPTMPVSSNQITLTSPTANQRFRVPATVSFSGSVNTSSPMNSLTVSLYNNTGTSVLQSRNVGFYGSTGGAFSGSFFNPINQAGSYLVRATAYALSNPSQVIVRKEVSIIVEVPTPTKPVATNTPVPTNTPTPSITLNSVTISGSNVIVGYNKNFATCAHLLSSIGGASRLTHTQEYFCASGNQTVTAPLSGFNAPDIQAGNQVKLCDSSNINVCSSVVTITTSAASTPVPTNTPVPIDTPIPTNTPPGGGVGGPPTNTPAPTLIPTPTIEPGTFICKYNGQIPTELTRLLTCDERKLDQDLTLFMGCLQDFLDGKVARCKVRADIDTQPNGKIDQGDITIKLKVWAAGKADHIKTRLMIKYR